MGRGDKRFFNLMRGQKSIDQKSAIRYGKFMRKKWLFLLLTVLVLAGVGWQRTRLLSWYYVRQLVRADKENRDAYVKRVADLDQAVVPRLFSHLERPEEQACDNVAAALACLVERWGPEDARSVEVVEELDKNWHRFSEAGKLWSLQVPAVVLHRSDTKSPDARLLTAASELLSASIENTDLRPGTLALGAALVRHCPRGPVGQRCRDLGLGGLNDPVPENRVRAVNLLLCAGDPELLARVVPLLKDEPAEVRRAALVALGPAKETVGDDDLLPLLHDADAGVRKLTEEALRSRGLPENHLLLAKLISDDRPEQRLRVVHHLFQTDDLPVGIWLRRLSQDPAPAVRAAAVRAAHFQTQADLRDRLGEMARQDPSPTVRQLASYYLSRPPIRAEN